MTEMNAATTTKALRAEVIPLLKAAGFDDWSGRKAWRSRSGCIDTVEFRSISAYDSQVIGCPTASLSVWFGSWPDCFQNPLYPVKQGRNGPRPREDEMPLRGCLNPPSVRAAPMQPDIWRIASVQDAELAAADIAAQFREDALDWLSRDWGGDEVLDLLVSRTSVADKVFQAPCGASLWIDCGAPGSPAHDFTTAGVLAALGRHQEAADLFEKSRWAMNHAKQEMVLFRDPESDGIILSLIAECRDKARTG